MAEILQFRPKEPPKNLELHCPHCGVLCGSSAGSTFNCLVCGGSVDVDYELARVQQREGEK